MQLQKVLLVTLWSLVIYTQNHCLNPYKATFSNDRTAIIIRYRGNNEVVAALPTNPIGTVHLSDEVKYTVNTDDNTVTSSIGGSRHHPIEVGAAPQDIVLSEDGSTLYVTNSGDDTVTPIDLGGERDTPLDPIPVGDNPYTMALSSKDLTMLFVYNAGDDTITPIDTATNTAGNIFPIE